MPSSIQLLQWGRAQLSAEGCNICPIPSHDARLQRGRAQLSAEGWLLGLARLRHDGASTGPRSIERGRLDYCQQFRANNWLQRGRAQLSAEGDLCGRDAPPSEWLQRGRAQLSAEGAQRRGQRADAIVASTGPRSIERGRQQRRELWQVSGVHVASTGPRSIERGRRRDAVVPAVTTMASTGPRSIERGRKTRYVLAK